MAKHPEPKTCEACNGAGQISFFQGVSRFFITWEECPLCGGLGHIPTESPEQEDGHAESPDATTPNNARRRTP